MFNTFMFDVPIFSFMGGLRGGVEVHYPPPPWSSMTTNRLVKLKRMAMHPKRLASISGNSVLYSCPRKLNYRRLEEG